MRSSACATLLTLLVAVAPACGGGEAAPESPQQPAAEVTPAATSKTPAPPSDKPAPRAKAYPPAPKKPVVNTYHGTQVTDDYQWLEDAESPEVKAWVDAENKLARDYLDGTPVRKALVGRIRTLLTSLSSAYNAVQEEGGKIVALKFTPARQQRFLVVVPSLSTLDGERVLVDPNEIDKSGSTAIDWYKMSPDGKRVAVSLSAGGSENGTVYVWEIESGKKLDDAVSYAHTGTAGGSLAWTKDGKGFYYTRHPHPGERPAADMGFYQQVYFHKLGTKDAEDTYARGKDFPKIAETRLSMSEDGKWLLASIQNGDGGEHFHELMNAKGQWTRFAELRDMIDAASFGADGKIYLRSRKDAPRGKLLRVSPDKLDLARAEVVVPEGKNTIMDHVAGKSRLYVADLVGGPSALRVLDLKGKEIGEVPTLPVSSVGQLMKTGNDDLLFVNTSFTEPMAWYTYAAKGGKVQKTKLVTTSSVSFEDTEVVREVCTSRDGTRVPITIMHKKGIARDGKSPTLLNGYGGYGVSLTPSFGPGRRAWIEQGGVTAVANLRGGGELGEAWHRAGNLTKKQNVFDDFYACAQRLVELKYTSPSKLAIIGGSNGGLLMGASLVQHPEMWKAVVSSVGIYDMLRVELTPNGEFNTTEFGSVKDPEQFKALMAYSPLHHVKDGTAYPAMFLLTGANDPRVDPFHSRKMAARLQAATTGGPVLLRASSSTGHGMGTPLDETIEQMADTHAFLFNELGIEYKPVE